MLAYTLLLPVGPNPGADWKQLLPHLVDCYLACFIKGLLLNVIELTAARLHQWHHASKPLSKFRQGEDLGNLLLPRSQTLYRCLSNDGVERTTGCATRLQQESDRTEIPCEAASHSTAFLLQSRCASRG